MIDSAIRTISIARSSPVAAAAFFEQKVQIWNLDTASLISEFDTVFGFGGHRLTLSPNGECCVAASFRAGRKGGVVCYEARSGRIIWQRADLRRVQGVKFSADGEIIWCSIEGRPIQRLDTGTGLTLGSFKTIRKVFDSQFTLHLLHVPNTRDGDFVISGSMKLQVARLTSAILDAAFSQDSLCLSEAGGPVRCLELGTAKERWRYLSPPGSHILRLSYQVDRCFYGVEWAYKSGGPVTLLRFSRANGAVSSVGKLNSFPDALAFGSGNILVSSGELVSLRTGSIIRRLAFPVKEYPDPLPEN